MTKPKKILITAYILPPHPTVYVTKQLHYFFNLNEDLHIIFSFWPCPQHAEILRPGIEPMPWQQPKPQQ